MEAHRSQRRAPAAGLRAERRPRQRTWRWCSSPPAAARGAARRADHQPPLGVQRARRGRGAARSTRTTRSTACSRSTTRRASWSPSAARSSAGSRLALATRFEPRSLLERGPPLRGHRRLLRRRDVPRRWSTRRRDPADAHNPVRLFAGSGMRARRVGAADAALRASACSSSTPSTEGNAVLANASGEKVGALGRPLAGRDRDDAGGLRLRARGTRTRRAGAAPPGRRRTSRACCWRGSIDGSPMARLRRLPRPGGDRGARAPRRLRAGRQLVLDRGSAAAGRGRRLLVRRPSGRRGAHAGGAGLHPRDRGSPLPARRREDARRVRPGGGRRDAS